MFDRTYLLNPFVAKTMTIDELSTELNRLAQMYIHDDVTQADVVFNICLESDLLVIYSVLIQRFKRDTEMTKLEADTLESKSVYQQRDDWVKTSTEKVPAMTYFEGKARELVKPLREKQINADCDWELLKRYYSSMESKQNALKKKLDSMKYDEV